MGARDFYVARQRSSAKRVDEIYIQTSSGIHRKRVVDRCKIPVADGDGVRACGHVLFEGEDPARFARHVATCAQENTETILAVREERHPSIMRPWDTELDKWISQHRQALLEGRMRI